MVQLDLAYHRENLKNLGTVDMTSVMHIEGDKLFVDLVPDLESYDYYPYESAAERYERRRKFWALIAVMEGFESIEKELGVKVIFVRNNCYFEARDLFDV